MKKESFEKIILGRGVYNVVITTNIARGLGINGVSYSTFHTLKESISTSYGNKTIDREEITNIDFNEDYTTIDVLFTKIEYAETANEKVNKSFQRVFIPYENIVGVTYKY